MADGAYSQEEAAQPRREVFTRHNTLFTELPTEEQNEYRRTAVAEQHIRVQQRETDVEGWRVVLATHLDAEARRPLDECPGVPSEINSPRLSECDIDMVKDFFYAGGPPGADHDGEPMALGSSGPPLLPEVGLGASIEEKV